MALQIIIPSNEMQEMIPQVTLDRKLWLTADKLRVVEDGDPEAAFLYGIEGRVVPRPEAEALGALPLAELTPEKTKSKTPTSNKMAPKPEDK